MDPNRIKMLTKEFNKEFGSQNIVVQMNNKHTILGKTLDIPISYKKEKFNIKGYVFLNLKTYDYLQAFEQELKLSFKEFHKNYQQINGEQAVLPATDKKKFEINAIKDYVNNTKNELLSQENHQKQIAPLHQRTAEFIKKAENKFTREEDVKKFVIQLSSYLSRIELEQWASFNFEQGINTYYSQFVSKVQEQEKVIFLKQSLQLNSYENSFDMARKLGRKFTLLLGPTNSGKTYEALQDLSKAANGLYLAPLRLMALENQESLFERGILANLITGEEKRYIEGATHNTSTIEMCDFSKNWEVAVIDEIQMISDPQRGWAWSAALVGVPAKHVYLVGSEDCLPYVLPILNKLGESYEIKRFERKNKLSVSPVLNSIDDLREGDALIAFSRKEALRLKNILNHNDVNCSIVYGNLSPEVRRNEAAKFKNKETKVLVATDAIGMGLNLPIHRIIFSNVEKFDGMNTRKLHQQEIKQIAGRAGRFGISEEGLVTVATNADDLAFLKESLLKKADTPKDTRVSISPSFSHIEKISDTLKTKNISIILSYFKDKLVDNNLLYRSANLEGMLFISSLIKKEYNQTDLKTAFKYVCAPVDQNSEPMVKNLLSWWQNHLKGIQNTAPMLPRFMSHSPNEEVLFLAEIYVKSCNLYNWLSYQFPEAYPERDIASQNINTANDYIEKTLSEKGSLENNDIGRHRNKKRKYYKN